MTMQAATSLDEALRRDVAVLSTLAHLHYATVQQLHALCFPYHTLATARISLHYLAEASFLTRSTWRSRRPGHEHGQIWTLAAKGSHLLQRYTAPVPPFARIDLARPSTALEHEEWRVRLQVRALLVGLLLEARRTDLLQYVGVELPCSARWPTAWEPLPEAEPDAIVSVVWHPAARQDADWLPWSSPIPAPDDALHYPIFIEREQAQASLTDTALAWTQSQPTVSYIPLLILRHEAHFAPIYQHLASVPRLSPLRLGTWSMLESGIAHDQWRDEHGARCRLYPSHGNLVG